MKAEADRRDQVGAEDTGRHSVVTATRAEDTGRHSVVTATRAEADLTTRARAKAGAAASNLMEAVVERGNRKLAYQRVVKNKGAAGVAALTVSEFKTHLQQHWPALKGRLLAGSYQPQAVRRVDVPKPQAGCVRSVFPRWWIG